MRFPLLVRSLRVHSWVLLSLCAGTAAVAADWNQWRGPQRNGLSSGSPPLIRELPREGLQPAWVSKEPFRGGWASPVIADGRIFLYTYTRERREGVELPPAEYPPLTDEQREAMSERELEEYDRARSEENRLRQPKLFTFHDNVHCLEAGTGEVLWERSWEGRRVQWGQSSTPAVVDGVVYVVGCDRALHALNGADGEILWQAPLHVSEDLNAPIPSSVAVTDGVAILLAGRLVGFDVRSGKMLWEKDREKFGGLYSSPAVWDGGERPLAIINVKGGETVAVEPATGNEVWRITTYAERSTPVVSGDRLITYASSRRGGLRCYRLSEDEPELLWEYRRASDPGASPVVVGESVYVTGDKLVACVDLNSGSGKWVEYLDLSRSRYSSPVAADQHVIYTFNGLWMFAASNTGYRPIAEAKFGSDGLMAPPDYFRTKLGIAELERTGGQQQAERIWQREVENQGPIDCTSPAVAGGRLYIRLKSGLACYDLRRE